MIYHKMSDFDLNKVKKEKHKEYMNGYNKRNKEYLREYYQKNKEQRRQYYQKNKERILAQSQAKRDKEKKEDLLQFVELGSQEEVLKFLLKNYFKSNLTEDYEKQLIDYLSKSNLKPT